MLIAIWIFRQLPRFLTINICIRHVRKLHDPPKRFTKFASLKPIANIVSASNGYTIFLRSFANVFREQTPFNRR